jgi:hypothetical protein
MISLMTRNQNDIESKTTTLSRIEQILKTTTLFINFTNFYKCFIHAFFKTSAELISFLKKNEKEKFKIKFVMISKIKIFMKLIKKIFMNASMLRHYEFDVESIIKTNVFDFVIMRIFSQFAEIDD